MTGHIQPNRTGALANLLRLRPQLRVADHVLHVAETVAEVAVAAASDGIAGVDNCAIPSADLKRINVQIYIAPVDGHRLRTVLWLLALRILRPAAETCAATIAAALPAARLLTIRVLAIGHLRIARLPIGIGIARLTGTAALTATRLLATGCLITRLLTAAQSGLAATCTSTGLLAIGNLRFVARLLTARATAVTSAAAAVGLLAIRILAIGDLLLITGLRVLSRTATVAAACLTRSAALAWLLAFRTGLLSVGSRLLAIGTRLFAIVLRKLPFVRLTRAWLLTLAGLLPATAALTGIRLRSAAISGLVRLILRAAASIGVCQLAFIGILPIWILAGLLAASTAGVGLFLSTTAAPLVLSVGLLLIAADFAFKLLGECIEFRLRTAEGFRFITKDR